ncbi:MAG: leucine-rich repeat domain-containing protein [Ruminococcus sp.]|nr:leucine-rich repeat domain-containing protein [Ruminococcus sp.]
MKGRFWRKALAAALALLVVSGNVPIRSVADLFGGAAITASAEEGEAASGQCGENSYFSFDTATCKLTISGTGAMYDYNGTNPWNGYNDNITSVVIENGITSIGELAFYSCKGLTSITIPDSVKSIGFGAFYDCTDLTSITLPDSVTSIGESAFQECTSLTSITIPDSVESIGIDAFYNCTGITDVYCYAVPNNLEWDDGCCDDFIRSETGKSTICHVPEEHIETYEENFGGVNVTFKAEKMDKCGDHAYWCFESDASKLTISGTGAMYDYEYNTQPWYDYRDNITSVKIENGITSIGKNAFFYCSSLTSVTIPDSVTSIGESAFQGCTSLTSITIPDSVTNICYDAFFDCTGITDVYCYADPANLTWDEVGCDDFKYDGSTVCHVPGAYYWQYVKKFGAESENPVNVTFDTDAPHGQCGDHAYWCFESDTHKLTISGTGAMKDYHFIDDQPWNNYKDNITSVEIEKDITSISEKAFFDYTNLTSITIPDSVKSIGESAFVYCTSLTSITIPDSVTSIGDYAFKYCSSLTSITIPNSVTSIGKSVFFCTGLTSITIPDSVKTIGESAFSGCKSLESITIPEIVTSIGTDAFCNCTGITDVYCYADHDTLTWNDGYCNDFKYDGSTVCHVLKKYLDDYKTNFGSESETPVNVKFVGDLVDMGLGEHLYGHSITLDGSIGVNFFVELTDELLASENAQMVFTVPNGSKTDTQTLLVKDVIAESSNKVVIGSKTYYKFKCSVSAKDMASEITAQLVDGEKSGTEYTYSVKEYADYLLSHTEVEEYENAAPLVKAMLNYGAASQRYFNEGAVIGEVEDMTVVTVPNTFEFDEASTALPEGVTFEGATLSLKSETTLSLYFKGLPADTKFTCDGKTVETAKNGEYVVARIRGIKASELENDFTVSFKGESMTYNAMAYCYNVLNGGTHDEDLQNVCKALYLYAQAAINYAG